MGGHSTELIATIAIGLGAAFFCGFVARYLRLPSIVGYLLAGVAVGPFTPGIVADPDIAVELAEIGVALLMFGVGLHFSLRDLMEVRGIAVPGALVQIAAATALGCIVGLAFGWKVESGLVLGLAISVASTVVLLRSLSQRDMLHSEPGRIAVGWLIVEDLFTVIALVLLPILATAAGTQEAAESQTPADVLLAVGAALGKAALLTGLMLVVGARVLPWLLAHVEGDGSRELFTLAVVAIALGVAFTATVLFDVSLALGAFLAGAVLSESHVSERAAAEVLPLTDVFTVLFFVSVGMLLDPAILLSEPLAIVAVLAVIVVGKSVAAIAIVRVLRRPVETGLVVAAALAQVGEFSFIVATASVNLGLLPERGFQLVVAAALISITLNPFLFAGLGLWRTSRVGEG
ncbi:MAG TPA: cation:proton antiporter [Actinomycetota bacterium]|nr:cation:proton antiporter [Actinomycetota bacterium]